MLHPSRDRERASSSTQDTCSIYKSSPYISLQSSDGLERYTRRCNKTSEDSTVYEIHKDFLHIMYDWLLASLCNNYMLYQDVWRLTSVYVYLVKLVKVQRDAGSGWQHSQTSTWTCTEKINIHVVCLSGKWSTKAVCDELRNKHYLY